MYHFNNINDLTKNGGRYYYAKTVYYSSLFLIFPFAIMIIISCINPFWFRDALFNFVKNIIEKTTVSRNRLIFKIYHRTSPEVLAALTSDVNKM
jgi:hypothetical protein